jgi:hypothetical protein
MTNNLLITGRGTIDAGLAVNTGTVVSASGALQFLNPSSGGGLSLQQNGTLVVQSSSQMIFGTASNAPIANAGTILMQGGNLYAGVLTNLNGARITGYGTMTSSIFNSGTILANSPSTPLHLLGANVFNQTNGFLGVSSGRLIVDSVFTNAGTVSILNSLGTFNSDVVNRGAWISDPSTTTFAGNFTVETNGYISMTAGDVMVFTNGASFINTSTMSNLYDTLNGKFIFEGGGGLTQAFYVAGIDNLGTNLIANGTLSQTNSFGPAPFTTDIIGYSNNFALGTLQVGTLSLTSTVSLIDSFLTVGPDDGHKAGLYVMNLTINPGSLLIISNNVELYFQTTNGITGVSFDTLTPGDNVLILGNGSFHQLEIIPEPSILMLLVIGGLGIYWRRRHRRA